MLANFYETALHVLPLPWSEGKHGDLPHYSASLLKPSPKQAQFTLTLGLTFGGKSSLYAARQIRRFPVRVRPARRVF
jgi:hypothetical protein